MTVSRRTRLTPERRRHQLLALGVELLGDRTLEELSIDELAGRAGISRGLMFHYFGSKQGFHREVVRAARDDFLAGTEPDLALPPLPRLRAAIRAYLAYVLDHHAVYVSFVRGASSGDAAVREVVDEARRAQTGRILAGCAELGLSGGPRLALAVRAWVALAEEAVVGWRDEHGDREDLAAFLEHSLVGVLQCVDPAAAPALTTG